jgi:betaine-aldehyde dehydrogenase
MAIQLKPGFWVGDRLVLSSGGEPWSVLDPARGKTIAAWPGATEEHVGQAVAAARNAFESGTWRSVTPEDRARTLLQVAARIREHSEELATLDSLNVGKPVVQARDDVEGAAGFFESYAHLATADPGEVIEYGQKQMTVVVREPIGVVGAIVPWNFPITVAAAAIGAPLASGNSVILKPSELTPLSAVRLAELTQGLLPAGVFSVLTGTGPTVGRALAKHPDVDTLLFTGSVAVGSELMATAASQIKRIDLELGGKSPTIVFADAPFDQAVASALQRIVYAQGENCAAGSRLVVEESISERFIEALIAKAGGLRLGDPQAEDTDLGPMISERHRARVMGYLESARREARELYVGPIPKDTPFDAGFYVPLSFWKVEPHHRIWREEVFGPLLSVMTFKTVDEAVRLANDTDYGLMAVVWSGDQAKALAVARRTRAGIIRINGAGSPIQGPWGGFKKSGLGRGYGKYGIAATTELKQINIPTG